MFEDHISLYKGAIIVKADTLMYWWSALMGLKGRSYAGAFYPFIFTTNRIPYGKRDLIINHELIHFAQQKEKLIVGSWILRVFEWVYWRGLKRKSAKQAYLLQCTEQEAYDKMWDLEYLEGRRRFAHLRIYLKHKPVKKTLTETVL